MQPNFLDHLLKRRSSKPALLDAPGPNRDQLHQILTVAARVPDHKKLVPWRFIVFEGDARQAFGEHIARVCAAEASPTDPPSEVRLATERERFCRAPLVVAVVLRLETGKGVPEIEQTLSAGAACMNLCHAANSIGFGTSWITEWTAFSPGIHKALGLADNESIAGFIYIGTALEPQQDRDRPDISAITTFWSSE